jgi:hypothetical protein
MKLLRWAGLAVVAALALAPAASAKTCVQVGVYQDNPVTGLSALRKSVGPGVGTVSTYLTAGRPLSRALIRTANRRKVALMVTWQPDGGRDGSAQPKYRLTKISKGSYDRSLRSLGRQFRGVRKGVIFRPMPEMNTPWFPWSGTANGNKPADFSKAWKRVRTAVRKGAGKKVKLLWAPYARSIPDTGANAMSAYFPGATQVDLVGADAYNFGNRSPLAWVEPPGLFAGAYAVIQALAAKPFWIAETGSAATGGDKAAWIGSLASLKSTMPKLAGVVWFDAKDPFGDFRIKGKATTGAFKALLKGRCA